MQYIQFAQNLALADVRNVTNQGRLVSYMFTCSIS